MERMPDRASFFMNEERYGVKDFDCNNSRQDKYRND